MDHQLQRLENKWWRCSICQWDWQSKPKTACPLLPRYDWNNKPVHLQPRSDLEEQSLKPKGMPIACIYLKKAKAWLWLYDTNDCDWQPQDQYLCKTTLKKTYLLSEGWIKQLGKPDLRVKNPHHRKFFKMQLYSRQRVEAKLAELAEEYAQWLDERDRYIAIFEKNRAAIVTGQAEYQKQKRHRRDQTQRCLQCASGCATSQGFLCAIHPMGLEVHQIPCPDWRERKTLDWGVSSSREV